MLPGTGLTLAGVTQIASFRASSGWDTKCTERWKYIRYLELDGMDELYDLKADPCETRNLISQPHAEQTLKAMRKELGQLLKQTSARESSSATRLKQSTSVSR